MLKLSLATTLFLSVAGTVMDSPVTNPSNSNANSPISKKEKAEQILALISKIQTKISERENRNQNQNGLSNNRTTFTEYKEPIITIQQQPTNT